MALWVTCLASPQIRFSYKVRIPVQLDHKLQPLKWPQSKINCSQIVSTKTEHCNFHKRGLSSRSALTEYTHTHNAMVALQYPYVILQQGLDWVTLQSNCIHISFILCRYEPCSDGIGLLYFDLCAKSRERTTAVDFHLKRVEEILIDFKQSQIGQRLGWIPAFHSNKW